MPYLYSNVSIILSVDSSDHDTSLQAQLSTFHIAHTLAPCFSQSGRFFANFQLSIPGTIVPTVSTFTLSVSNFTDIVLEGMNLLFHTTPY